MNNHLDNIKQNHKGLFSLLIISLSVFLITLIVLNIVEIQNSVKTGRYIGADIESKNNITVSDTGEVYTKPDLAMTSFSVIAEAKTVEAAMSDNTSKMNKVIAAVKAQGADEKDLKTTNFSINPRYEYNDSNDLYPRGQRVLVGYEVSQSLQVKIRDMEKIGQTIQAATDAGANQVSDLQFTVDDQDVLKTQAREEAIDKAKDKAQEIASELGVKLVKIINFSESSQMPYYAKYDMAMETMGVGGADESMNIETGENKVSVSVSITYEID